MNIDISKRVEELEESPTMAIMAKAKALRAEGKDIIGFTVGEPDFDTPGNIKEAAKRAIDEGHTKYTPVGGIPELKNAIIKKFQMDNSLEYRPEEILVSCGGKHSIYNLCQAIIDPGDEVIIPSPYWVSFPPIVELAGGSAVIVETNDESGFKMSPAEFKAGITGRTKALILNSPSNPTGSAYTLSELEEIAKIAIENKILIISDEIYEKIVYDGFEFTSIASISDEIKDQTIVLNGVSKTYAMTGWRIGYAAGAEEVIRAMGKVQSQSTSNASSISQWAAVEAISGPQDAIDEMVGKFTEKRKIIVDGLNAIAGVECRSPQGAFYAFPNVSSFYGKKGKGKIIEGSADLAAYLLDFVEVAVVPGVAFGSDAHLRLSYACSIENITEGLKRIEKALNSLS
ncbi:MAG: pyridoxal phosphate-dependent aminotransferase [Thermodesulfobacteriota bacterium]